MGRACRSLELIEPGLGVVPVYLRPWVTHKENCDGKIARRSDSVGIKDSSNQLWSELVFANPIKNLKYSDSYSRDTVSFPAVTTFLCSDLICGCPKLRRATLIRGPWAEVLEALLEPGSQEKPATLRWKASWIGPDL